MAFVMVMCYEKQMVRDLIWWIEDNIEEGKTIDDLVNHVGYSRRTVQLMFKNEYGLPVGTYMRQRKMCRAATLLRLTKLSVIDIANRVHFNGAQNFSRAFKKSFNMSPTEYRNLSSWDLSSLVPSIDIENRWQIDTSIIYFSSIYIDGEDYFYQQKILTPPTLESQKNRLKKIRHYADLYKNNVIIASNFSPSKNQHSAIGDCIDVTMLTGIEVMVHSMRNGVFYVEGGRYAKFVFHGRWSDYLKFSYYIYMNVLPKANLHRRSGFDIESFHYTEHLFDNDPLFTCEYFIPVD
ncbi:helix-turn-helix domain-containing protein [Citrobacter braakii]|uniref:helix-turn-helix domain-containing protein n=1 Tax=Citrobacter braakii TaxID=57706 RepID=UPI0019084A62|nr:helix-turn-helix domain-containing protein [Citrobacter braakii]MBJ9537401.1 helix-turn-helix domain-containing protein [Citrobacter braakii]MBJ9586325.1 helix-turn-helix domain-containing protein [Citrobacter braakii]